MTTYHSPGKLLLTGEYVVLDGAMALALPTRHGQTLTVQDISSPHVKWKSLDQKGNLWFQHDFSFSEIISSNPQYISKEPGVLQNVHRLLHRSSQLNLELFRNKDQGYQVTTQVDFPLDWGLGSSSTLIANISKWLKVDPYELLEFTFGGSGYDVAVAMEEKPLTYQLSKNGRSIFSTPFDPPFKDQLFFVHLNKKQNSRSSIVHYETHKSKSIVSTIQKISSITQQILTCNDLKEFNLLIEIHENLISRHINLPKAKTLLFPDFAGSVKSLGGWGGDFILATGGNSAQEYFKGKGYQTVLPYSEIIQETSR